MIYYRASAKIFVWMSSKETWKNWIEYYQYWCLSSNRWILIINLEYVRRVCMHSMSTMFWWYSHIENRFSNENDKIMSVNRYMSMYACSCQQTTTAFHIWIECWPYQRWFTHQSNILSTRSVSVYTYVIMCHICIMPRSFFLNSQWIDYWNINIYVHAFNNHNSCCSKDCLIVHWIVRTQAKFI
jgi:hypothetical protein